jgi:dihydroflavonol-4-reductase
VVAVTGATGHLGTVLVRRLVRDGADVRYLARGGSPAPGLGDLPAARVEADLFDRAALVAAFDGADVVYHCAGRIAFWPGEDDALYRVNVEGTRSVLAAAREARVRRVVHVGSIEAFALESGDYPITEEHGVDPERTVLAYGRTKAIGILESLAAADGAMDVVVCCPTAFIGPPDYRRSALGAFVLDYLRRRLPAAVDGGFDFVDVRDVADGLIRAGAKGESGRLYLLGGEYATIPQLIDTLEQITGIEAPALTLPVNLVLPFTGLVELFYRLTRTPPRFTGESLSLLSLGVRVDSSRARRELGYAPRPIRDTLADTAAWFAQPDATEAPE